MTQAEVSACLARGRAGDEGAILQLFEFMYPHVLKLVRANLPARESAEDLVQQVCIKVITNLHQFSDTVPFLHWISRIAVNTCINQVRHEKRRPEVRFADLGEDEAAVVEQLARTEAELDSSQQVAARELTDKLLDSLRPHDRLLMRLMYLEGRNVEEIAAITGWKHSAIKVRAFRARLKLRKTYAILQKEAP